MSRSALQCGTSANFEKTIISRRRGAREIMARSKAELDAAARRLPEILLIKSVSPQNHDLNKMRQATCRLLFEGDFALFGDAGVPLVFVVVAVGKVGAIVAAAAFFAGESGAGHQ
jgi:hypothetical protein